MGRHSFDAPLRVYLNNRRVGTLSREASSATSFSYHDDWLSWEHALPVSLSLPLRETTYRGEPVLAVFENLLPDSERLRRLVAERVSSQHKPHSTTDRLNASKCRWPCRWGTIGTTALIRFKDGSSFKQPRALAFQKNGRLQ